MTAAQASTSGGPDRSLSRRASSAIRTSARRRASMWRDLPARASRSRSADVWASTQQPVTSVAQRLLRPLACHAHAPRASNTAAAPVRCRAGAAAATAADDRACTTSCTARAETVLLAKASSARRWRDRACTSIRHRESLPAQWEALARRLHLVQAANTSSVAVHCWSSAPRRAHLRRSRSPCAFLTATPWRRDNSSCIGVARAMQAACATRDVHRH